MIYNIKICKTEIKGISRLCNNNNELNTNYENPVMYIDIDLV